MTFALIYHDVAARHERDHYGPVGPAAGRYKLDPAFFEAHLDAIEATGLDVGLVDRRPPVALTFDDGGRSAPLIADALERRGWSGHFFVTTEHLGTPGFIDADGVRDLISRGHDVGSHSHSHPTPMGALTRSEIAREWRQSQDVLGEIIGTAPRTAAVPGGFLSPVVIEEAARAGYELLMTSQPTSRCIWHNCLLVHGRYTIWATTSARRAAAYAKGDRVARATMWLGWQAKAIPKRLSPNAYETVRRRWPVNR